MNTNEIWKGIEEGKRSTALDVWKLLQQVLERASRNGADPRHSIREAAILAVSAVDRMDQRETELETLLFELRSERNRCRQLDDLLVRLLDQDAPDHIATFRDAFDALAEIESAVQSASAPVPDVRVPDMPASVLEPDRDARNRKWAKLGCGVLICIPVLLLIFKIVSEHRQATNPSASEVVSGASIELLSLAEEGERYRMGVTWASRIISASSTMNRSSRQEGILRGPDVYVDANLGSDETWSPRRENDGLEWVEIAWNYDIEAAGIIIVEAPNGGAITAVDEIRGIDENKLGAADYVRLWSGTLKISNDPRFVVIHLPEKRYLRGLRIVLDTAGVEGRNAIDAVGLISE